MKDKLDDLFSLGENKLQDELGTITQEEQLDTPLDMSALEAELSLGSGANDEAGAFEEVVEEKLPTAPLEAVEIQSIIESLLLATDRPLTMAVIKEVFKGTYTKTDQIRRALDMLAVQYAGAERGIMLEEVAGGYQLRTKEDNRIFVRRMTKARPFRLSGPGLETLAIIAYKQPVTKHEVDEIRGVESGHLVRALMDRGIVRFGGKSDLPGKPMLYETTRKFLEIFGLRDLRELPSVSEIQDLIPEGIAEDEQDKQTLSSLTEGMSMSYEHDEGRQDEYEKISSQLADVKTTTDFFEQEKERQRMARDAERADDLREMMASGAQMDSKDVKWLEKYEKQIAGETTATETAPVVDAQAEAAAAPEIPTMLGDSGGEKENSSSNETEEETPNSIEAYQEKKLEEALADFDQEDGEKN